jgi:hypothetical protein
MIQVVWLEQLEITLGKFFTSEVSPTLIRVIDVQILESFSMGHSLGETARRLEKANQSPADSVTVLRVL